MSEPAATPACLHKRGRVPARKGCLKSPLPSPGPECAHIRKSVAFGEDDSHEIYVADVWDRTPTEPARKLSYQDLLELKEIQRSLPRANQLPDPVSGRPGSHYLAGVPIGLLPLLPESDSGSSQGSSAATSPIVSPSPTPSGLSNPCWLSPAPRPKEPTAPQPWHPPHLAHLLPSKPVAQRPKPTFAFLPLLETPPVSQPPSPYTSNSSSRSPSPEPSDTDQSQDPPTPSLTNASLDSSPLSRASSTSPEPPFFQLPPSRRNSGEFHNKPHLAHHEFYASPTLDEQGYHSHRADGSPPYALPPTDTAMRLATMEPLPPRPLLLNASLSVWKPPRPQPPAENPNLLDNTKPLRRRNVIEVNGVEIVMDDDDDDDDHGCSPSTPNAASSHTMPSLATGTTTRNVLPIGWCSTSPPPERGRPAAPEPKKPSSPPPTKCMMSLHSPIRFQRNKGPRPGAM